MNRKVTNMGPPCAGVHVGNFSSLPAVAIKRATTEMATTYHDNFGSTGGGSDGLIVTK